jgi:hypothetical protein
VTVTPNPTCDPGDDGHWHWPKLPATPSWPHWPHWDRVFHL